MGVLNSTVQPFMDPVVRENSVMNVLAFETSIRPLAGSTRFGFFRGEESKARPGNRTLPLVGATEKTTYLHG